MLEEFELNEYIHGSRVDLYESDFNDLHVDELINHLNMEKDSIKDLSLNYTSVSNEKMKSIIIALHNCSKLTSLRLMGTQINDEIVLEVAKLLQNSQTIELVDLQFLSNLTDIGLMAISETLVECTPLKTIFLEKNRNFTERGARYLAEKLSEREKNYPGLPTINIPFREGLSADVVDAFEQKMKEIKEEHSFTIGRYL